MRNASTKALITASFAAAVSACDGSPALPTSDELGVRSVELAAPMCETTGPPGFRVDTIASGLEVPWDVVFLEDGRALVTERPGRIRVVTPAGQLMAEPWAVIDVFSDEGSEVGLLGIDAFQDPDGRLDVYVATTTQRLGSNAVSRLARGVGRRLTRAFNPERGHSTTFQVVRLIERGGSGVDSEVVVGELPSFILHGGGSVRIGPDGFLYVSNGDAADPPRAQLATSTRGKILRYDLDGSVPASNPIQGSPTYASGVRHVQGMDWMPDSGELLAIDHGPTGMVAEGFRTDHDELNVVGSGDNLGWPIVSGATEGGTLTSPIAVWTPAIAPAGLSIYDGDGAAWQGSAFVTGLRGVTLRRLQLDRTPEGIRVGCEEVLFDGDYGRLRLNRMAPDGTLWIGTSNRDGRGIPRSGDDLILRVHPPPS